MLVRYALLFACTVTGPILLIAQPGSLDLSYGTDGSTITDMGSGSDFPRSMLVYPDGSAIVHGTSGGAIAMAKYDAQGVLVPDFGTDGIAINTGFSGTRSALQADGRIVIAGSLNGAEGGQDMAVGRFLADGTPDSDFGTNGKLVIPYANFETCSGVRILHDGRILLVGDTPISFASPQFFLAMVTSNGELDGTFGTGGVVQWLPAGATYAAALDCEEQADGSLIVVGGYNEDVIVARFTSTGDLDMDFNGTGFVTLPEAGNNDKAIAVHLDAENRILILATGTSVESFHSGSLYRFDADGAPDAAFDGDGHVALNTATSVYAPLGMTMQDDGAILVTGGVAGSGTDLFLARYATDGTLDTDFGTDGHAVLTMLDNQKGVAVAATTDGRILVGAEYWWPSHDFMITRFWESSGLGVGALAAGSAPVIAPNPVQGTFSVNGIEGSTPSILVEDMTGRAVPLRSTFAGGRIDVEATSLAPGTYVLRVRTESGVVASRFVKE